MKGVAIAMETIIFIVLAVLVMAVLIAFLFGGVNPADDALKQIQRQNAACQTYVNFDPTCTDDVPGDIAKKLAEVCNKIEGFTECKGDAASVKCARQCCRAFCALGPDTKE